MAAVCRLGVESGKHVWPSTPAVPSQAAQEAVCPRCTVGATMSSKTLGQRIYTKCCVKIGKCASETSALLTFAYGENALKKSSVYERQGRFKEGREHMQDDPRSGQPETQRRDANVDRVRTLVSSHRRLGVRLTGDEGYGTRSVERTRTVV
jgi:hypothetical protein